MTYFLHRNYWQKIALFGSFLFCFSQISSAQVKFTASANEALIGREDLVQIKFKIENAQSVRSIDPPSFDDFEIVSGPNQESGTIINNGDRSYYAAVSFILKPKKTGKLSILPATAFADGKQIKSNPVSITVTRQSTAGSSPRRSVPQTPFSGFGYEPERHRSRHLNNDYILRPGENPQEKIKKNLFVRLDANKKSCYVGEPIVVSFKLYTRLLSKTNVTDAPSFNGFSVTEMDVNENATEEKVNGKIYNCYTLRKVQLFPMREGTYTISPLHATNKVSFVKFGHDGTQADDPFMQLLQEIGAQSLSAGGMVDEVVNTISNELTVHVKPLPALDKPENFRGAVGNFAVHCNMDKEEMTTDDAGSLALTISGSGNMALINAPEVKWPAGVDAYDAKVKEQFDNQQVPVAGSKTFHIPFTVSKPGNYSLPPIHFSWFDPSSGKYESTVTEPISFMVSQGSHLLRAAGETAASSTKGFLAISRLEWATGIVLVAGLTILLLFVFFRKKNRESDLEARVKLDDLRSSQAEDEFVIPDNPLEAVHEKLKSADADGFYQDLNAALKKYLSGKLNIPLHELSKEKVLEGMDSCNVGIGTTKLFESLVREIDLGLYAKSTHPGQMRYLYEKSAELIALLDKQICK